MKVTPNTIEKNGVILTEKIAPKIRDQESNTALNNYQNRNNTSMTDEEKEEKKENYFDTAFKEREDTRKEACEIIEETLKDAKVSNEEKASAIAKIEEIGARMEKEANVQALLKAKGFKNALVIISEGGVTAVVSSEGLTSAQTLQIQDILTSETGLTLQNIKIIPIA